MGKEIKSKEEQNNKKNKTIFGLLFSRQEKDADYMPELKAEWGEMAGNDRVKFIVGAVIGLILFIGALILVYFLLTFLRG